MLEYAKMEYFTHSTSALLPIGDLGPADSA